MLTTEQYRDLCGKLEQYATLAAESRRNRRAHEHSRKNAIEKLESDWKAYLEPYNLALEALEPYSTTVVEAMNAEKPLIDAVENLAAALYKEMAELRAQGHEVSDPPAAPNSSYVSGFDAKVVAPDLVPAKYKIVDLKAVTKDLKTSEVPGVERRLTVTLRVEMLDADFKRFENVRS